MIITELILDAFGKFSGYRVQLGNGLNIIYGENESGKTTIHKFIEGMFFGFFKPYVKTKRYLPIYNKYFPWGKERYTGVLKYKYRGDNIRIERNFIKGSDQVKVFDDLKGEDITYMCEFDGVTKIAKPSSLHMNISSSIYKNTISIGQLTTKTDQSLASEVKDRLLKLGGSLDEEISVKDVLKRLDDRIDNIGTENRVKTSEYGKNAEKLTALEKRMKESLNNNKLVKEYQLKLNNEKEHLKSIQQEKDKIKEKLKIYDIIKLKEKYIKIKGINEEIERLKIELLDLEGYNKYNEDDYIDMIKIENKIESLYVELKRYEEQYSILISRKDDIYNKISSLEEEMEKDNICYMDKLEETEKIINKNSKIKMFLSQLFFIGVLMGTFLNTYLFIVSILSGVINIILKTKLNKIKKERDNLNIKKKEIESKNDELLNPLIAERNMIDEEISQNNKIKEETNINIQKYKDMRNKILEDNGIKSVTELIKGLKFKERYKEIKERLINKEEVLKSLLGDNTINDLIDKVVEYENINTDEKIESWERLNTQLEILQGDIENKKEQVGILTEKIKGLSENMEHPWEVGQQIIETKENINRFEKQIESLNLARNTINDISTNMQKEYAPKLNQKVSNIINYITKGKYTEVKITEGMNIKVVDERENKIIDVNSLSEGTIDQLYFALRIATIDIVTENRNLPIFLDDAFVQYDDNRLKNILRFLMEESKNRQIIIFTCQNREKKFLEKANSKFNYIEI
ncbi:ATP-binding protein [Clostridiisalibacter paucivorans]|uniref:ATP-binding protein n=1 Tax=Clostridiisalibacter paucivorans TaxID=408753 RepID=UPI00047C0997|nr:AAA family ATPase [Clostridiisalibacter paucivorans]